MASLKRKLREGRVVFGPFMKLASPAVMEIFGLAGFDYAIIDTEHGPMSIESAENLVRAAELTGVSPVIRIRENNPSLISRALDIGAEGVQVPQIGSAADAEAVVKAAKFAPQGERGVCRFVRAARYTHTDRFRYFRQANEDTCVIIHIEGRAGVDNIDAILAVPGIDVAFIGPYDLSQSLGVPGQVNHPEVERAMAEVVAKARARGVAVGTFVDNEAAAAKWSATGIQYISYSVDVGIIYDAARDLLRRLGREPQDGEAPGRESRS